MTNSWHACWLFMACALVQPSVASADYPLAHIQNNTEYAVSGTVEYASALCRNDGYSVAPGGSWTARSRGVCLITGITGSISGRARYGESLEVVPYDSTGTSYSKFQINAHGGQYRIFSDEEHARVSNRKQGRSPGFYFVNKTDWPVLYSLDQAGCLYHDVIAARWNGQDGVRRVDTGAVWFTLRVAIQPDGVNPQSDWDCVEPVAEIVGDVLFAAMSGGASGAAAAAAKAGAKYVTKQVAKAAIKRAAKKALKASIKSVRKTIKERVGEYLKDAGTVTMGGQYAGYEWPFQCGRMPEYHITGGPELVKDENGDVYLRPGGVFTVTKVNDCGDDMMLASPRSSSAESDAEFPTFPGTEVDVNGPDEDPPVPPGPGPDNGGGSQGQEVNANAALEMNMDRPGGDLVDFDLPAGDPNLCRARCVQEPRCRAFTYASPGAWMGGRPHCWLKQTVTPQRAKSGHQSGVVRGPADPLTAALRGCATGTGADIAVGPRGSRPSLWLGLLMLTLFGRRRVSRRR